MLLVDVFAFCLMALGAIVVWRAIMRSKWFNRFCASVAGPQQADAVLSSLDEVERMAVRQADEAEALAQRGRQNAEQIRTRLRGSR